MVVGQISILHRIYKQENIEELKQFQELNMKIMLMFGLQPVSFMKCLQIIIYLDLKKVSLIFYFNYFIGNKWDQDDDHLALMIETLGHIPKKVINKGKYSRDFFNKDGQLKNIKCLFLFILDLKMDTYTISKMLVKDGFNQTDADEIEKFLLPMLEYDPAKRPSA